MTESESESRPDLTRPDLTRSLFSAHGCFVLTHCPALTTDRARERRSNERSRSNEPTAASRVGAHPRPGDPVAANDKES